MMVTRNRPSYRQAIEWIAANDDTEFLTADNPPIASVSLALVADLFGRTDDEAIHNLRRAVEALTG